MAPRNGQFRVRTGCRNDRRLFGSATGRTRSSSIQVVRCSIETIERRLLFSGSPLSSIPALSSLPGATATFYLDFHGESAQPWGWSSAPATPAYDTDGDPSTYSAQELTNVQQIWSRVSEAFSPFNVNVTTVDPGNWNLDGQATTVPGAAANNQLRVVIGGNGAWIGTTEGGAALTNSYSQQGSPNTVYVFSSNLGGDVQFTADDCVHEIGHALGLNHQSIYSGATLTNPYNPGNGSTAPFMGNPLTPGIRGTWWDGPTQTSSTMIQDDLAVIASPTNGFGFRPITTGQSAAGATALGGTSPGFSALGVIESTTQTDYYSLTVPVAGAVSLGVNAAPLGPMLHSSLELRDANNQLIQSAAASSWGQSIVTTLNPGTYYLVVKSFGQYGDLGQYAVNAQLPTGSAKVAGRYLFYNGSVFDGNNLSATRQDDSAVATDKQPLMPGSTGQFANISSYSQGINGLMIDISNLPTVPTLADFSFGVGTSSDPSLWTAAAAPNAIRVRAGAGNGGATRVEFTWANGSIINEWLQVTVQADASTGLKTPGVFYFGSLVGCTDAATTTNTMVVTSSDLAGTRADLHGFLNPVDQTNIHDFNRDGRVDLTDQSIVRLEARAGVSLNRLTAPIAGTMPTIVMQPICVSVDPTLTTPSAPSDPKPMQRARPRRHLVLQ